MTIRDERLAWLAARAARMILVGSAFALLAGCVVEPAPRPYHVYRQPPAERPNTDVYAYPQQNQPAEQQDRDRFECHEWAVQQTSFDPSAPGVPPHDQVRVVSGPPPGTGTAIGAVAGALLGAAVSGPRDAGAGALFGALAGGAVGSASDAANASNAQAQAQAYRAQDARQSALMEQKASNYRRAVGACLEARGYSVK